MRAAEIIRAKRDGLALTEAQIQAFVRGLVDGSWSEGQAAALAMAIVWRGMTRAECVALTLAMAQSGQVLDWRDAQLPGPLLDKHSTGGVGDKVSLPLAAIVAACGGVVPMVSGRGLGHTGGTLDKLEALPGYTVNPPRAQLLAALRSAGCAIVGAGAELAPADRRLYAIRDVTATVESVPLITASILGKKLSAGLQGLVLDVKLGNGAFLAGLDEARGLARSLVDVARGAGLPTQALVTDMNQPLGRTAGNALEVAESIAFLTGAEREPRLLELTLALAGQLLHLGGLADQSASSGGLADQSARSGGLAGQSARSGDLAASPDQGRARAEAALASGAAAEHFARMVAALGGPPDVLADACLPLAPEVRNVAAPRDGVIAHVDTRALGLAVVALGGGRERPGDAVDPRVGLARLLPLGTPLRTGEPLLQIHAASPAAADAAQAAVLAAITLADAAPAATPVVVETLAGAAAPG